MMYDDQAKELGQYSGALRLTAELQNRRIRAMGQSMLPPIATAVSCSASALFLLELLLSDMQ